MIKPYIVGDVHLGRKFVNNVPLHRRGDREQMVRDDFVTRLHACTSTLFVQTADLFDAFNMEEELVLWTARQVRAAALKNPHITYVFYRGNHDASKDVSKASSFDVFAELLMGLSNVHVLKEPKVISIYDPKDTYNDSIPAIFGFVPWSPFKSAQELSYELVGLLKQETEMIQTTHQLVDLPPVLGVFGHWDVESYGGDHDFNMVPTALLSKVTKTIWTGHVHKPSQFERDGVTVHVVGSMQPYAHGEDPHIRWYKTTSFEEFSAYGDTEKAWCRNINLRVLVKEGQHAEPIDCLSFQTKKVEERLDDEQPDLEVKLEDFNMVTLFQETLVKREVRKSVMDQILEKFGELRNASS